LIVFFIKFDLYKINKMEKISILSQLVVGVSVLIIWTFRRDNIDAEFKLYKLSNITKNIVGSTKISLATMLILGIWYSEIIFVSSLCMAFFMLSAQYFHFKASNPWHKYIPSLIFLILSLLIAAIHKGLI